MDEVPNPRLRLRPPGRWISSGEVKSGDVGVAADGHRHLRTGVERGRLVGQDLFGRKEATESIRVCHFEGILLPRKKSSRGRGSGSEAGDGGVSGSADGAGADEGQAVTLAAGDSVSSVDFPFAWDSVGPILIQFHHSLLSEGLEDGVRSDRWGELPVVEAQVDELQLLSSQVFEHFLVADGDLGCGRPRWERRPRCPR